jgi:hypothetical protein
MMLEFRTSDLRDLLKNSLNRIIGEACISGCSTSSISQEHNLTQAYLYAGE